jgi:hypothetical protein
VVRLTNYLFFQCLAAVGVKGRLLQIEDYGPTEPDRGLRPNCPRGNVVTSSGGVVRVKVARLSLIGKTADNNDLGSVKANKYRRFSASNPAERGGNSSAKTAQL